MVPLRGAPHYTHEHVFLATQMSCDSKNVSTHLSNLKAADCCGMHVPEREATWEENHKKDFREHPVLHVLFTRGLDYLLWASLFSLVITKEEKTLSKLREVGSRGSKTTGAGLSHWQRLRSPGLPNVPSTLSLPPPAHASQPAGPPQGSSFITTQSYDSGICLMGSLFMEFDYSDLREHRASVGVSWKSEGDLRVSKHSKRRVEVKNCQPKQSMKE